MTNTNSSLLSTLQLVQLIFRPTDQFSQLIQAGAHQLQTERRKAGFAQSGRENGSTIDVDRDGQIDRWQWDGEKQKGSPD